jgi:hypothetical protein
MRNNKGQFVKGFPTRKITSVVVICPICKKEFLVEPHRFKSGRGKFCSTKCRQKGIYTPEVRLKMSLVKKGIPTPQRARDKCHFWKGGITPINRKIRMSMDMRLWREAVFKRDNWTCVWCGVKGGRLNADHIKRFSDYPELRFAIDNGRTLCRECHFKTDNYGYKK